MAPVADIATAASKLTLNPSLLAAFSFPDRNAPRTDATQQPAAASSDDECDAPTAPALPSPQPPSPAALQTRVRVALLVLDKHPARACHALKMLRRLVHDEPGALEAVVREDLFRLVPRDLPAFAADAAAVDNACKLLGQVLRMLVQHGNEDLVNEAEVYLYTLLTMQARGCHVVLTLFTPSPSSCHRPSTTNVHVQTACRALCTLRPCPPSEPAALLLQACVGLFLGTALPEQPPPEEQVAVQDLCGVLKHHAQLEEPLLSAVLTALIALAQVLEDMPL